MTAYLDTEITYLEMRAPPATPPLPPPRGDVQVVHAVRPTLHFYRYLYDTVGADYIWSNRRLMDQEELHRTLHDERVELNVLWVAGVPAGFAELDSRRPGVVELVYFGLMPEFIGQGLGRHLLDWAVRRAWALGCTRVRVNTCTLDHPRALPSYKAAGFEVYDRRPGRVAALPA